MSFCNFCHLYLKALFSILTKTRNQSRARTRALPWFQTGLAHILGRLTFLAYLVTPLCPEKGDLLYSPLWHPSSLPKALQLKQNPVRCLSALHHPFWRHCPVCGTGPPPPSASMDCLCHCSISSRYGKTPWPCQIHLLHLTLPSFFQTVEPWP